MALKNKIVSTADFTIRVAVDESERTALSAFAEEQGISAPELAELTTRFFAARQEAMQRWPNVEVNLLDWVRFVFDKQNGELASEETIPPFLADTYLAYACLTGQRAAMAAFERECRPHMMSALRKLRLSESQIEEVVQTALIRLIVAESPVVPRIGEFRGTGSLRGWARATAVRLALMDMRANGKEFVELSDDLFCFAEDGATRALAQQYAGQFKIAVTQALEELPRDDRILLRMVMLDGLGVGAAAKLHRVHRISMSRRLRAIRQTVLFETRRHLKAALGLSESELTSAIAMIESQLEASVARILG